MSVIQIARFTLKPGTDEQAFLAVEQQLRSGQIAKQPGFISRDTAKGENGEWVVAMKWASGADAAAWTPKFMADPDGQAFAAFLDFSSMRQDHYTLIES